jgi:hypothetical protein
MGSVGGSEGSTSLIVAPDVTHADLLDEAVRSALKHGGRGTTSFPLVSGPWVGLRPQGA